MAAVYHRPAPGSGKPYGCDACGRKFVDARSLRQHAAAVHAPARVCAEVAPVPASMEAS